MKSGRNHPLGEEKNLKMNSLITAERHKLDALTRHTRGLMQQLFSSPGEVAG